MSPVSDTYMFDTDIVSLFEEKHPIVTPRILAAPPARRAISVITVRERLDGWYKLFGRIKTPEEESLIYESLADTVRICAAFEILPYDVAAIARFKQLQKMKLNVGLMDLRIAAVALEQGAILVTANVRDFARVPGLTLEDWTQP